MAWRSGPGHPGGDDPDGPLVDRVRRGDSRAFDALVLTHQDRLVNYVRAMVADRADAEDVVQDAFLRAYRAMGQFKSQSRFKTWLYQIATNVARTHAGRRESRHEAASGLMSGGDAAEYGLPVPASPDDLEARIIARDRLDRALAALPEDQRQAVVLRDVEGWDYREIAEIAGIPIGTVESRIYRARQRLRELLAPDTGKERT